MARRGQRVATFVDDVHDALGLAKAVLADASDADLADDLVACTRLIERRNRRRAADEPPDAVGVCLLRHRKCEGRFVGEPSGDTRMKALDQILADVEERGARPAAQVLHKIHRMRMKRRDPRRRRESFRSTGSSRGSRGRRRIWLSGKCSLHPGCKRSRTARARWSPRPFARRSHRTSSACRR